MIKMTSEDRADAMRLMRAYGAPDDAIGRCFGLSRQRVHVLLGARPLAPPPDPAENPSPEAFAAALRAWRLRRGLSQARACELLALPRTNTLTKWESGRGGCALPGAMLKLMALLDRYEPAAR